MISRGRHRWKFGRYQVPIGTQLFTQRYPKITQRCPSFEIFRYPVPSDNQLLKFLLYPVPSGTPLLKFPRFPVPSGTQLLEFSRYPVPSGTELLKFFRCPLPSGTQCLKFSRCPVPSVTQDFLILMGTRVPLMPTPGDKID